MGRSKPEAEREGTPSDETAPASDRVLRPRPLFGFATSKVVRKNASDQLKPPQRPKPPPGFYTSIEARMNAFDLSSDGFARPPKPPNKTNAINHATLPSRNASLPGKPAEVIVIDSDSDEAMEEELTNPPPKSMEAMQIDLYSTEAERKELKRAARERKRATRKAFRPVKQMIHKAIPNTKQRQKFYEQGRNPDRNTLEKYLEEIRLKEIALRVMVEYCTTPGSVTQSRVDDGVGGALGSKPWSHDRSRFAEGAPLREWEFD